ncbi:related to mannan endo-1,6-alpha-mannosidase DCW1 precursor [Phialocephala subalpina]|uniref:Mannan endo-1,6-alpha-mannosidase n=1 Tax=Phialocephala subalpina TaxID=576137 RepID=A0A1L7X6Q1_9HELO|nr:related to mannan endo-1,6-alpha-mannosidase DCW1 precursor [Phialocephala subalpina]
MVQQKTLVALAAFSFAQVQGITFDTQSADSVKSAASTIASGMISYYNGNETGNVPGLLPAPYYWWEGGALFDTLLRYWQMTGDTQYNDLVSQALVFQQGPNGDYMPPNQTKSEGNDDQAIWALAAMSAAELKFPESANTSWISMAEAVFNDQAARWDTSTCNGGLRWQIFTFNNGYNYKNSASNGLFFQLASRLARYTGNTTYSDWASKVYDWSRDIGFIDEKFNVFDGSDTTTNCTSVNHVQFSYCAGTFISGAAYLYNATSGSSQWKTTLDGFVNQTLAIFFSTGIADEEACESHETCTVDMKAFKGILAQDLTTAIQLAPYLESLIMPILQETAKAAADTCTGGVSGTECALSWTGSSDSSDFGLGQQLSALSYVQALLVSQAATPVTMSTGGSNGTVTTGGGASSTSTSGSSTTSGSAATTTNSAAVAVGKASISLVAALLGSVAWMTL